MQYKTVSSLHFIFQVDDPLMLSSFMKLIEIMRPDKKERPKSLTDAISCVAQQYADLEKRTSDLEKQNDILKYLMLQPAADSIKKSHSCSHSISYDDSKGHAVQQINSSIGHTIHIRQHKQKNSPDVTRSPDMTRDNKTTII